MSGVNGIVVAQTVVDDESVAYDIAQGAVEARLAAGAHVDARMTTFTRWKETVRHERQYRVSFQTTPERAAELREWVHARHTHEVPQWFVLPADGATEAYLDWTRTGAGR
ncbi:divalent-cation tolerance protein CutA [Streptomyces sp. NPDC004126]|uniref:divalent-cation tolerance protein CutA n=1 Tax=Streptomyces sp. NPDC004126 TaxID=3390695 RepID=UPI003CFF4865